MFKKARKLIKKDLQRRYDQLEERFLIFERRIYGQFEERLDKMEQQFDQLAELLRQQTGKTTPTTNKENSPKEEMVSPKKEKMAPKKEPKSTPIDDLTQLKGIGKTLAQQLHANGISSFLEVSKLNAKKIETLDSQISGFAANCKRYDWPKQAKELI